MAVSPDFIDRCSCLRWRSPKLKIPQNLKLSPNDMTQANEPNDSQREINRRFRDLSWRVERLETSQMPARSLNESFDRVYDEIDALEGIVNQRFDRLESEVSEMRLELREIGNKFDIVMNYITGQSNS
jgi:hypothetical protein